MLILIDDGESNGRINRNDVVNEDRRLLTGRTQDTLSFVNIESEMWTIILDYYDQ